MQFFNASDVFDRTAELFGPSRDFLDITDQTFEVAAVGAVELFDQIQIVQVLTIEHDVILTPDFRNTVDRKTHRLKKADADIQYAGRTRRWGRSQFVLTVHP